MKSPSTYFYATGNDLVNLFKAIESEHALRYTETGLFDSSNLTQRDSLADLQGLGVAQHGDRNLQRGFLVHDRDGFIEVRSVPQRSGGIRYAVDQQFNPRTAAIRLGGMFGHDCLISSSIGTAAVDDSTGLEILKLIRSEIMKQCVAVNGTFVGSEAHSLLNDGVRLTANAKSPVEFDLTPDHARD